MVFILRKAFRMFFKFNLPCRKSWLGCLVSLSLSLTGSPLLAQTAPTPADSAAKKPAATTSNSKAKKKTSTAKCARDYSYDYNKTSDLVASFSKTNYIKIQGTKPNC